MRRDERRPLLLLGIIGVALVASGISPHDRRVWALEVFPWVGVLAFVALRHRRHPMTPLAHAAIFALCLLFLLGAHFTYSRVPVGLWLQDALGLSRNPYDRVVHFAGGFVGGLLLREILVRRTRLGRRTTRTFVLVCLVALAGAAVYEILEWWIAVAAERSAEEFLAMQGDEWDTQWDMALAVAGSFLSQLLFSRLQDRQMAEQKPAGT